MSYAPVGSCDPPEDAEDALLIVTSLPNEGIESDQNRRADKLNKNSQPIPMKIVDDPTTKIDTENKYSIRWRRCTCCLMLLSLIAACLLSVMIALIILRDDLTEKFPLHPASFKSLVINDSHPVIEAREFERKLSSHGFSVDPLPSCSALSKRLTLNILTFIKYVQAPHLHAACDNGVCNNTLYHLQTAKNPSMRNPSFTTLEPHWVQFSCVQEGCGGWSDRLKGIFSTLLYALLTERAVAIDVTVPVPLSEVLLPGVLPWLDPSSIDQLKYSTVLGPAASQMQHHQYINLPWNLPLVADHPPQWPGIKVQTNHNSFSVLFETYPEQVKSFGFDPSLDLDAYFGCFYQTLFTPSTAMGELITGVQSSLRSSDARSDCPPPPLLCAQIRFGAAPNTELTFHDSEKFFATESVAIVLNQINKTAEELKNARIKENTEKNSNCPIEPAGLMIVSDSAQTHDTGKKYFASSPLVKLLPSVPGPVVHIDKRPGGLTNADARLGLLRALSEYHLLGLCDRAIVSNGGYGSTAIWRTSWTDQANKLHGPPHNLTQNWRYEHVTRAMPDAALVPMTHRRGGDGRQ